MSDWRVQMPQMQQQYFCLSKLASALLLRELAPVTSLTVAVLPKKCIQIHGQLILGEVLAGGTIQLRPYDMAVMDAAYTLYLHCCPIFTVEMAVRALYGDACMDVTAAQRQAVLENIRKLSCIRLEFDATDEWKARRRAPAGPGGAGAPGRQVRLCDWVSAAGAASPLSVC